MLKSIRIKNIQSHADTYLQFSPGINTIVGSSDNGKTAILRALYWARYNRPLGSDILSSYWARDKKGKVIQPMVVTIENDSGILERMKDKSSNIYGIGQPGADALKSLEAVKSDVPEEVEKFFRLSETNIQSQQDSPFLLSASAADVARYFNRIVRLDIIDKVLSGAESTRRKINADTASTEKQLTQLDKSLEDYEWIESAEAELNKLVRVEKRLESLWNDSSALTKGITEVRRLENISRSFSFIEKAKALTLKVNEIVQDISVNKKEYIRLGSSLQEYNSVSAWIGRNYNKAQPIIFDIEKIENGLKGLKTARLELNKSIVTYNDYLIEMNSVRKEIEALKKELPDICPLCGATLNKE
jgi:DNA repair exonuclease SbcCD ATPase subunit